MKRAKIFAQEEKKYCPDHNDLYKTVDSTLSKLSRKDDRHDIINSTTGQTVAGGLRITYIRPKIKKGLRFMMLFQDFLESLAKDDSLTITDHKTLLYLLSLMDFENTICVTHQEVADSLNIARQHITKSINKLEKGGYLERVKRGGNNFYKVTEDFVWKGRIENMESDKNLQKPRRKKSVLEQLGFKDK
jgi:biotin operon repressor